MNCGLVGILMCFEVRQSLKGFEMHSSIGILRIDVASGFIGFRQHGMGCEKELFRLCLWCFGEESNDQSVHLFRSAWELGSRNYVASACGGHEMKLVA